MNKKTNKRALGRGGFTLIELLVVVLIIGILAAIAIPQYFKVVERSRFGEASTLADTIKTSEERVFARNSSYEANFTNLDVAIPDNTGAAMAGASGNGKNYSFALGGGGAGYTLTVTRLGTAPSAYPAGYTAVWTCGGGNPCKPVNSNANVTNDLLK